MALLINILLCCSFLVRCAPLSGQDMSEIGLRVAAAQKRLEDLRGEPFKHAVKFATQSPEAFGAYLDETISRQLPESASRNYGKVVRKLGLYSGPELKDFRALARKVMQSQAAAYYDPEEKTFFVVMQGLSPQMLDAVYTHELYHGFQDQYHDLSAYLLAMADGKLNDDQLLARQAVVEGEATYLMTLSSLQTMLGSIPPPNLLRMAVQAQSQLGVPQLLEMVQQVPSTTVGGEGVQQAIADMQHIPGFILENMVGAYLKGMAFVFEIQQHGWKKVDELYTRPPVSTEQILHPDKWLADEKPVVFAWPDETRQLPPGWHTLETNTLGELQLRQVFTENGLHEIAEKASAGWNGDSFKVIESDDGGTTVLLLATSWDSSAEAKEFSASYNKLARAKYPGKEAEVRIWRKANEVYVTESVPKAVAGAFSAYVERIARD